MSLKKKLKYLDPFTYVDMALEKVYPVKGKKSALQSLVYNSVYLISAVVFAFVLYSALGLLLSTSNPLWIVLSASMEPLMHRGDIVILQGVSASDIESPEIFLDSELSGKPVSEFIEPHYDSSRKVDELIFPSVEKSVKISKEGSIVVYFAEERGIQVIHRAVAKIHANDGTFLITKGDANPSFDQDCGIVRQEQIPGTDEFKVLVEKPCITPFAVNSSSIEGIVLFKDFKVPVVGCLKLWVFDDFASLLRNGKLPEDFAGIC